MPYCPKCGNKLTKRKSDMSYSCKRHGFARFIVSDKLGKSMRKLSKLDKLVLSIKLFVLKLLNVKNSCGKHTPRKVTHSISINFKE